MTLDFLVGGDVNIATLTLLTLGLLSANHRFWTSALDVLQTLMYNLEALSVPHFGQVSQSQVLTIFVGRLANFDVEF